MSSLWYFIPIWAGLSKVLGKIKALLCNYLWLDSENKPRPHVSWDDYVLPNKVGGLRLASLEDATRALVSKWIIQALLPTQSNLQVLYKVPHHAIATVLPWLLGSFLSLVVLIQLLY